MNKITTRNTQIDKEPKIEVGILIHSNIEFTLKGNFTFNDMSIPSGKYSSTILNSNIETSFANHRKIILKPFSKKSTFIIHDTRIGIGFHWEQKEDQEFEGDLCLHIEDGKIRVVNSILLETYLQSVIASEMSAMNDISLLEVHAIVSRSWILAQILKKNKNSTDLNTFSESNKKDGISEISKWYDREDHTNFDVCSDDHCQRYQGITKIISPNIQKVIDNTKGKVLVYNNKICDARFSKCCGGISEDFNKVWQPTKVAYLRAIRDQKDSFIEELNIEQFIRNSPNSFCNTTDKDVLDQILIDFDRSTNNFYRWKINYTQEEISALLLKKSGIDFGNILEIVPLERGKSGRIIRLKIFGSKRVIIVGKELEIRKWLSESHLYSSAFLVEKIIKTTEKIPERFILRGAGWGHGVGMCQIGAAVMCKKGYSITEILAHYFKDSIIKKLY